jgi:hypothetical protein
LVGCGKTDDIAIAISRALPQLLIVPIITSWILMTLLAVLAVILHSKNKLSV